MSNQKQTIKQMWDEPQPLSSGDMKILGRMALIGILTCIVVPILIVVKLAMWMFS